jgi:hypothetical protein
MPHDDQDETYYDEGTPAEVRRLLEHARKTKQRIRVHYGDPVTGRDWGDVYDVSGTIGRSMGPRKIPLLLSRKGSMGGGAILTKSIVRIRPAKRGPRTTDWYRHPTYAPPSTETWAFRGGDTPEERLGEWKKHFGVTTRRRFKKTGMLRSR